MSYRYVHACVHMYIYINNFPPTHICTQHSTKKKRELKKFRGN